MKKKILLGIVVGLQLLTLAAWAKDTVVVDRSVVSAAEQLNIDIPASTAPGFHDVQIQISDAAGVVSEKTIQFCKNLKGEIHWNNICPDLEQPFDPLSDPKGTTSIAVTALALLGAVGGSIAGSSGGSSESSNNSGSKDAEQDNDQSSLESIDAGELIALERAAGWGDKRRTWRAPLTSKVDYEFGLTAKQFSRFSPLISRLLLDGTYLRSMIGSLEFLIYPLAIYVGFHTLNLNGGKAAPSTLGITIIGMIIGLFDAYAGFVIASIFTIGVIVEGNFNSRHHILTTLGVSLLYFGPALLSSALRPIRREVRNFATLWERGTDYALAALLGGWASQKLVGALGGLSGFKLSIMSHANQIGIIVGCAIIIRMVIEDFETHSYPVRHKSLLVELDSVKSRHRRFVLAVNTLLFFFTAEIFIGNCFALWLGTALYLVPTFISKVGSKLSTPLISARFLPKGALKTLMMIIIGGIFGSILQSEITDNRTYAQTAFVILMIPGLLISSLYTFAGKSQPTMKSSTSLATRYLYRLLGVGVFVTLICIVKGNDVAGAIWNFISK